MYNCNKTRQLLSCWYFSWQYFTTDNVKMVGVDNFYCASKWIFCAIDSLIFTTFSCSHHEFSHTMPWLHQLMKINAYDFQVVIRYNCNIQWAQMKHWRSPVECPLAWFGDKQSCEKRFFQDTKCSYRHPASLDSTQLNQRQQLKDRGH